MSVRRIPVRLAQRCRRSRLRRRLFLMDVVSMPSVCRRSTTATRPRCPTGVASSPARCRRWIMSPPATSRSPLRRRLFAPACLLVCPLLRLFRRRFAPAFLLAFLPRLSGSMGCSGRKTRQCPPKCCATGSPLFPVTSSMHAALPTASLTTSFRSVRRPRRRAKLVKQAVSTIWQKSRRSRTRVLLPRLGSICL